MRIRFHAWAVALSGVPVLFTIPTLLAYIHFPA